jgi:hypothetical protein
MQDYLTSTVDPSSDYMDNYLDAWGPPKTSKSRHSGDELGASVYFKALQMVDNI